MQKMISLVSERYFLPMSLLAIVVLSCIAYGACINNGFVWDDETFIVNNPYIHDLASWPDYFTKSESISNVAALSRMYRPLQTVSFALDAAVWNSWAGGYHLTSLLLHIAASFAIIFAFGNLVDRRAATLAAVIFSIHPALSEGVLSLASRGNQLYTLFALLAVGYFVRVSRPFDRNHLLSLLAVSLSLLSKEPAIIVVALLPVIQAFFDRPWKIWSRQSVLLLAPFLALAGLYLAARMAVVDTSPVVNAYWGGSLGNTLIMQSQIFVRYFRLLVWPFILIGRYYEPYSDPLFLLYILINVLILLTAFVAFRRGAAGRLLALAIAWFYISLAPVSNIIPIPGSMMGERFIYFTFAGMFPLLAAAIWDLEPKRAYATAVSVSVLAAILLSFLIMDIQRTGVWKNNSAFFAVLAKQQPDAPLVQILAAKEEVASGKAAAAVNRLERIIKTLSTSTPAEKSPAYYWYGRALLDAGRFEEAFQQFSIVVLLTRTISSDLVPFLVEAAARSGNLGTARSILEKELRTSPMNDAMWNNLGNILLMEGDAIGGRAAYARALAINPANNEAAINFRNAGGISDLPQR